MSYERHTQLPPATLVLAVLLAGCGTVDVGPPLADINTCRPSQAFFAAEIWPNFLSRDYGGKRCSDRGCHDTGAGRQLVLSAPTTALVSPLPPEWVPLYRSATRQLLCTNVSSSALLARPDGRQTHAVKLIDPDGPEAALVKMWVSVTP